MKHKVKVYSSQERLPKMSQLAWKIAEVAFDKPSIDQLVREMAINRVIDNTAVALAAINQPPVAHARNQALAHPRTMGATVLGMPQQQRFHAEWAAWANSTAVRELDMNDTFLAADYSHPSDAIPPLLAVAQQCQRSGMDLIRGIVTAYEIHVSLVKGICLHKHNVDHIAHLCPAVAAGIGALLALDSEVIYQSVQQSAHVSLTTRQSRKGDISTWKAFAPAYAGKLAIEAVDRAMRGETSPSPIYEGESSIIASVLDGPDAVYEVPLPIQGESKRAILESYPKEHSAEYQAQALIDLAFRMRTKVASIESIERVTIYCSHHTHHVIGTGSNDPQKFEPSASRETLDHSIMYIFAVALQDGNWHHSKSYTRERAGRSDTIRLWHKIQTVEDPNWTRRYHEPDANDRAYGGRVEIVFKDGRRLIDEMAVANAHPLGCHPFQRNDYIQKFNTLTEGIITNDESERFLDRVSRLERLSHTELAGLNVHSTLVEPACNNLDSQGIFDAFFQ